MRVTYTPFLHAKDGEFTALRRASEAQLSSVFPLFEIGAFTDKVAQLVRCRNEPAPICAHLGWVVDSICESVPTGPVMLDTFAWPLDARTETGEVPIAFALNALVERNREAVPVVGIDRWEDADYRAALKSLSSDAFPIWGLRMQTDEIDDAAEPEYFLESVAAVLHGLGLAPKQVGIFFDFGDLRRKSTDDIIERVARAIDLLSPNGYRFYSVIGCSMPPSVAEAVKKPNTQGIVIRKEMLAWRELRTRYPTLAIAFGDYGIRGPASSDAPNPQHINGKIRYTAKSAFYVARGQSVQKDDGEQMYRLSNIVASSPHFQGPAFSWGDSEIYRRAIRETKLGPGNANSWIQFDTSHHIAWTVVEVAEFEQSMAAVAVEI
ncbi:MAG: beta family protein [Lysobacter sp.]|nr:beta family protein [Lysobacter sp.]